MKSSNYILTFILLYYSVICQAQLTKGTKTIGLGGNISASFGRYEDKANDFSNHFNSQGIGGSYSFGSFLNKSWLVGGGIGVSLGHGFGNQTHSNSALNSMSKQNSMSYNATSIARYYLKNGDKQGAFLFVSLLDYGNLDTRKLTGATNKVEKNNGNSFNWTGGMGVYKMLNSQIAAEGTLSYSNNQLNINASLRNFITPDDKVSQDAPPQYIAQNRWLVDPNFNLYYYTTAKTFGLGVGGLVGKMISDRFMVGSGVVLNFYKTDINLGILPFIRYYIPVTNRLYVFPYISASMSYNKNDNSKNSSINFDRGIGYNYFIKRNIALSGIIDAKWSHYHSNSSNTIFEYKNNNSSLGINTGISYFLK